MIMTRSSCIAVVLFLAACGSKESQPTTPAPTPAPAATTEDPGAADTNAAPATDEDPAAGCAAMFVRLRDCTAEFIPALVSWRVELDVPAGIAAMDQKEGRDALVSTAMAEWKNDSTDEAIAGMCGNIVSSIPAEQLGQMLAKGRECVAQEGCSDVVTCIEPMQRERLQAQKAAEGTSARGSSRDGR
jgi:hypothetical protein